MRSPPLLLVLLSLCAAASASAQQGAGHDEPTPAAESGPRDAETARLARAVLDEADRGEHAANDAERRASGEQAARDADACLARDANAGICQYAHAVALGLAAREHPMQALGLIKQMVASLKRAEATVPDYDSAGPERVQAVVLMRAPGWPLGPGDKHAALAAAQRAVDRRPDYPDNWLTLSDVQRSLGHKEDARASAERAHAAAERLPESAGRSEWLGKADRALGELR